MQHQGRAEHLPMGIEVKRLRLQDVRNPANGVWVEQDPTQYRLQNSALGCGVLVRNPSVPLWAIRRCLAGGRSPWRQGAAKSDPTLAEPSRFAVNQ